MGTELKVTLPTKLKAEPGREYLTQRRGREPELVRATTSVELSGLVPDVDYACAHCYFYHGQSEPTRKGRAASECGHSDPKAGANCEGIFWIPVTTYLTLKLTK